MLNRVLHQMALSLCELLPLTMESSIHVKSLSSPPFSLIVRSSLKHISRLLSLAEKASTTEAMTVFLLKEPMMGNFQAPRCELLVAQMY